MAEFIYTMRKARKAHGDKVILDDVTLNFLPGAKIGVVGPNGAGKSTVLKIMAGLEQPSNGDAFLSPGFSVGILMQEPELDENKTVLENVQDGAADIMGERGFRSYEAFFRLQSGSVANVRAALDFYRRVGATRYIREAEELLAVKA